jgi:hypothetical protein
MDETVSCCEEARLKIVRWFEEHAEKTSGGRLKAIPLFQIASDLSEQSCEDLEASMETFLDLWDINNSPIFDSKALQEIMLDWDRCDSLARQRMNNAKRNIEIHRE